MNQRWIASARCAAMVLLGLLLLLAAVPAWAQPIDVPPTWGGDFWSRPRLTGSWLGLRDELGKKGVVFDVDLLLTPQSVMTGGRDTGSEFWGNADYSLNIDTGKLGLWPGGFLKVSADSGFGQNVFNDSGAIVPVNAAALVPFPDDQTTALTNATFMQFLSTKFGLVAGKIYTLDGFQGEFAGNYRTQFMNTGMVIPASLVLVPLSAYGGGLIGIPWENVLLSAMLLDPSGTPTNNDISEAFDDGFLVLAGGKVTIKPFGLVGHQQLGGMWSDKKRLTLSQDPSNVGRHLLTEQFPLLGNPGPVLRRFLERFFPQLLVPVQPARTANSTWAMYYAFDQYLWQPKGDAKRGIGMFFTFGASDGIVNPIKYSYNVGIGGNGIVPGRPHDNFGAGWQRAEISSNFVSLLRQQLGLGLDHDDAVELYYNAWLTAWLGATLDLQILNPALNKALSSSGTGLKGVDTAVVGGIRLYVRF
ncbi:MAG: carbohydrate porin [Candidatus Rokuibacteriota bacterium]